VSNPPASSRAARGGDSTLFLIVGVIAVAALVMRTLDLGERASHHDESLHALYSYHFAQGLGYEHDPLMHGPLQFHLIALTFKLLGVSDATSRAPAALFGAVVVAMPLLLRRYVGATGVIAMALLLAVSPSLLYYSRFARNEAFVAVETLLLAVAIWRYRREGGMRWLVALAVAVALEFATKETAYLIAAVFLLYVNGALTGVLLDRKGVRPERRFEWALALFPVAWLVAATWPVSLSRFGGGERPREVDLLVVLGTLVLPYLAAAIQVPLHFAGITLSDGRERLAGGLTVSVLIVVAGEIGVWWDGKRWLMLAVVTFAITVLLFTTFFTNPSGFAGAYWNQLDYWLAQQSVQRGTQPWYYYGFMVPLYEFLALVPALVGGIALVRNGDGLARLLGWWALGTFLALSVAGEKMPWLTVHVALPLAILGGYVLGRAARVALTPASPRRTAATLALAGAGLLALLTVRNGAAVAYGHPDTPVEPLIYTQSSPDIPVLARQIEAYAATHGGKENLPIVVDASESMSWPWAWYLRDYQRVSYEDSVTAGALSEGAVLLLWRTTEASSGTIGAGYATAEPYVHRWWFNEDGYRSLTLGGVLEGILDGSTPRNVASFYWRGDERWRIGKLDGIAFFPDEPPRATLPSTGASYGR
jgi:uncharacterized protein (TIGR03663 family)